MRRTLLLALLLSGCEEELILDDCPDDTTLVPYNIEGPNTVRVNGEAIYALEGEMPWSVKWWLCGRNTDWPTWQDCVPWDFTARIGRYGQLDFVRDGTDRVIYRPPAQSRAVWIVATVIPRSSSFCPPHGLGRKMVWVVA